MPPRPEGGGSSLPRSSNSTALSIYPTDSVQDVAESLGLPPLKESVAATLAADVEYRLRQVVQDASKFMKHGERNQLRVADIDRALKQRNIEPIFGFHPTTLGKSSVSGAYPTAVGSTFRRIQTQSGPIHVVTDEEIDLDKVLDSGPKVSLGPGVGWSAHWLAIEGVQPAVPQNPVLNAAPTVHSNNGTAAGPLSSSTTHINGASAILTGPGGAPGQAVAKPLIKHVLSRELQLYFERLTTAIIDPPRDAEVEKERHTRSAERGDLNDDGDIIMTTSEAGDQSQSQTIQDVEIMATRTSGNTVRDAALASLRGDSGLHQLVPYLIQWVGEKIQSGLRDESTLEVMLHTISAILRNPFLGIEAYLHQLLPFVLSILLTSTLGSTTDTLTYMLRSQAGSLLAYIIAQYGATYPTLKPRLVRTALSALDAGCKDAKDVGADMQRSDSPSLDEGSTKGPRESSATKLGAVIGLRKIGPGAVRTLLVQDASSSSRSSCYLKRLGSWCERVESFPDRRIEVESIVKEVVVSRITLVAMACLVLTCFFSVRQKSLNVVEAYYGSTVAESALDVEDSAVPETFGDYWSQKLASEERATRALKLYLSEARRVQEQTNT
jgi:transcription initiation factor TFIID subunit 6